jgi:DNA-binding response OmpR family regulator
VELLSCRRWARGRRNSLEDNRFVRNGGDKTARILIVEDDEFLAVDLELTLANCGYAPTVAPTVSAALLQIEGREVDAAVLDVSLFGGESAYQVADVLLAEGIPFIFLTGRARHHLPARFQSATLLSKPYKLAELLAALREALPGVTREPKAGPKDE